MSKTKSRRRPSRPEPVEKFAGPVAPRSDLQIELDSFDCEFTNASNVLHCVVQTMRQADDILKSEDGSRALNVAYQCSRAFDALEERLDGISLRIAHEGIPAQYGPKASATRARRRG